VLPPNSENEPAFGYCIGNKTISDKLLTGQAHHNLGRTYALKDEEFSIFNSQFSNKVLSGLIEN